MDSPWDETTLGNLVDFVSGGTPSKARDDYWGGAVPWVSAKDMKSFRLDDTEDHLTSAGTANGTKLAPAGGVLLLTRGMTLLNDVPICVAKQAMAFNQDVKAVRPRPGVSERFLPYLLLGYKERLRGLVDLAGHGTGRLPTDSLKALEVRLPPLADQEGIAHVLEALDDKMELNRRMSATLEEIARGIFKSWFVDFDPVRAKAEGRDPGLPRPIADLFPDRLAESESGEIPAGWRLGSLGEIAVHPRRPIRPDDMEPDGAYIALEHLPRRSITLSSWGTADGLESNKFAFKRGEVLFGKLRPYFHKVGVAPVDGVCSTDIVVMTPVAPRWFGYLLAQASSDDFVSYTDATSTGTRMPRTSWKDMARYRVVLPSEEIAEAFNQFMVAVTDRLLTGVQESRCLVAIRDALLPKLISGEVRVASAEASYA